MHKFVLLSKLTRECKERLRGDPEILIDTCNKIKECNVNFLTQLATMGPYDFVNVVEVESEKVIYRISAEINSLGVIKTIVMPALPLDEYLSEIKKMTQ